MFEIGFWEIFLIVILALLIIGPERLPGAARTAGYWVGRARRYIEGVRNEVEQEFDISEFKRLMHNQEIQINELQRKLSDKMHEDVTASTTNEEIAPSSTDDILSKYEFHDDPIEPEEYSENSLSNDDNQDKKDKPLT
jgi:sec-independent protein translocase protein TatB